MTYVLVLILISGTYSAPTITTQEMSSKETCFATAKVYLQEMNKLNTRPVARAICTPK